MMLPDDGARRGHRHDDEPPDPRRTQMAAGDPPPKRGAHLRMSSSPVSATGRLVDPPGGAARSGPLKAPPVAAHHQAADVAVVAALGIFEPEAAFEAAASRRAPRRRRMPGQMHGLVQPLDARAPAGARPTSSARSAAARGATPERDRRSQDRSSQQQGRHPAQCAACDENSARPALCLVVGFDARVEMSRQTGLAGRGQCRGAKMKLVFPGGEHPQVLLSHGVNRSVRIPTATSCCSARAWWRVTANCTSPSMASCCRCPHGGTVSVNGRGVDGLMALRAGDSVSIRQHAGAPGRRSRRPRSPAPSHGAAAGDAPTATRVHAVRAGAQVRAARASRARRSGGVIPVHGPTLVGRAAECRHSARGGGILAPACAVEADRRWPAAGGPGLDQRQLHQRPPGAAGLRPAGRRDWASTCCASASTLPGAAPAAGAGEAGGPGRRAGGLAPQPLAPAGGFAGLVPWCVMVAAAVVVLLAIGPTWRASRRRSQLHRQVDRPHVLGERADRDVVDAVECDRTQALQVDAPRDFQRDPAIVGGADAIAPLRAAPRHRNRPPGCGRSRPPGPRVVRRASRPRRSAAVPVARAAPRQPRR